ncbi:MAG: sigma 54-interacting transcriptional regulator [Proteobacteria bacterium]|nr:sigma 54-interacting transcriptional regulator [Pseudomonadota bacterium]
MEKLPLLGKEYVLSDQWLQLLDQLNIGAFTIDLNRKITAFNRNMQALLETEDIDVVGKDCREVFVGLPCHGKCPFRGSQDPDTEYMDVEIVDKHDSKHLITRMVTPLYSPGNQVTGCLTVFQDHSHFAGLISRIHYEERSMKIILDNLDIGIFTVNRGGYFTFFNTAAEKITGYKRNQMLGRLCSVLFGQNGIHDVELLKKSITDGQVRTGRNGNITTREGVSIPIRADYMPLQNETGEVVGGLATIQDLTLAHQLDLVISERHTFYDMLGKAPLMQAIFDRAQAIAKTDATVLIEGETGTGKDLLAKGIHSAGRRADKPMIKVNCAAIPDNLLESEMFGYAKGAFTGADRDKPGRFQEADGGTIYLDEIGDLPLPLQAKLLRVLEDREFYPLGSRKTTKVDVRIISATNRDLEKLAAKGGFRQDLFYRLNVIRIKLPTLKERQADLPLLISHIMRRLCAAKASRPPEISRKAMEMLLNHNYPGNIRELENILEHALIICQSGTIEPDDLPDYLQNSTARQAVSPVEIFGKDDDFREREKVLQALQINNWHRDNTAHALGIERTTLWRKMKKYGLLTPIIPSPDGKTLQK